MGLEILSSGYHPTVLLIAEYDVLRVIFRGFEMSKALDDPTITKEFINTHYKKVSAMLGYTVLPLEIIINQLAYICLGNKQYDRAYQFFQMNTINYPGSYKVYDSLGDFLKVRTIDQSKK